MSFPIDRSPHEGYFTPSCSFSFLHLFPRTVDDRFPESYLALSKVGPSLDALCGGFILLMFVTVKEERGGSFFPQAMLYYKRGVGRQIDSIVFFFVAPPP